MTQPSSAERSPVHHFVLVTDRRDLLDDDNLEALYEAGCTDASIGHRTVEFDREASTRWWPGPKSGTPVTGISLVALDPHFEQQRPFGQITDSNRSVAASSAGNISITSKSMRPLRCALPGAA